jgi:hypothetical protein
MLEKLKSINFLSLFVKIFDVLFSCFIVAPLVVIFWRSLWKLCEYFLRDTSNICGASILLLIGLIGQFVLCYYQNCIEKLLHFTKAGAIQFVISRVLILINTIVYLIVWCGLWKFVDLRSNDEDAITTSINIIQNSIILMILKSFKNCLAPPFMLFNDFDTSEFSFVTFFRRKVRKSVSGN